MADVLPSEELVEEPSDYGALRPGTRLGRYELLVPIARGGMARVWAARLHGQRGFQKLVAIKVILPNLADEPEFERMFLDEARIASCVHHPNVCEIYELGEEKKTLYLVMEWVSGDSFARVLRANGGKTEAVEPRVVARIVADACAGVHAAHELTDEEGRPLGVVHRDLSPHNILITASGTSKVCDFGVAKALGQLHEATSAGQLKGKIAYMAPEQITGAPVDRRSDVFSLGCVLYEATTGQRPFRGEGDHQVMHAVLKGEVIPPTSVLRSYPPELERIVMRALAPEPTLRFPTAERMRFSLERYVAHGQLVTQSNVAQVLKTRIGHLIERRKDRIRLASSAGDRDGGWSEPQGGMTPSNQARGEHRSGVKPSGSMGGGHAVGPLFSTMHMERPAAAALGGLDGAHPQTMASPETVAPQTPRGDTVGSGVSHPPYLAAQRAESVPPPRPSLPPTTSSGPSWPPPNPLTAAPSMPPRVSPPPQLPTPSSAPPPYGSHPPRPRPPPYATFHAQAAPPGSPFAAPSLTPPLQYPDGPASTPQAGAGQYAMAIVAGILVAALIGVAGFLVWRSKHALPPPELTPSPVVPAVVASSAAQAVTPVSTEVSFRLAPPEATLSVEGKDLPSGVRVVPRPAMGQTLNVVVRAQGFEAVTVLVDYFTTSPMDLALKTAGAGAAPPAATAALHPAEQPVLAPKDPREPPAPRDLTMKRPGPPRDLSVPANPY